MAFETHRERNRPMSEINVTPLVDVVLVLLIVFMISASIESIQVQQEKERIELEIKKAEEELLNQKVPVNLPKTSSEAVNLSEEKKFVLSMNNNLEFFIGETSILKCLEVSPELKEHLKKPKDQELADSLFAKCLDILEKKLVHNEKLKQDREIYLRADRNLDYGFVLKVMARVRRAGVEKFGLISEPE